jgi:hypothetical protein
MDVNKIKIVESIGDKNIVVPISINPDFLDREASIIEEEQNIVEQIIGTPTNYELLRFPHVRNSGGDSSVTYQFGFSYNATTPAENSYLSKFTEKQVRFFSDSFKNSFFKLDFYDSMDPKTQKNYLTVILPPRMSNTLEENACSQYDFTFLRDGTLKYTDCCDTLQSLHVSFGISPPTRRICVKNGTSATFEYYDLDRFGTYYIIYSRVVDFPIPRGGYYSISPVGNCPCDSVIPSSSASRPLSIPTIITDYNKNQEGFFLYWFEDEQLLGIENLYMTAKFFNAATGRYIRFIVNDQTFYTNTYRIPNNDFYYRVRFDYTLKEYVIYFTSNDQRTDTVYWYEYQNPPIGL